MDQRDKIKGEVADCTMSLATAIFNAGGSVSSDKVLDMTVRDFISTIAGQNNIRFEFVSPENRRDAKPVEST